MGGTTRLAWYIGEGNAKYMLFTAEKISAQKALQFGLVQEVVPDDKLMERAREIAETIAYNAPLAISMEKKIIHDTRNSIIGGGLLLEAQNASITGGSEDDREGFLALKKKRRPNYKKK